MQKKTIKVPRIAAISYSLIFTLIAATLSHSVWRIAKYQDELSDNEIHYNAQAVLPARR